MGVCFTPQGSSEACELLVFVMVVGSFGFNFVYPVWVRLFCSLSTLCVGVCFQVFITCVGVLVRVCKCVVCMCAFVSVSLIVSRTRVGVFVFEYICAYLQITCVDAFILKFVL